MVAARAQNLGIMQPATAVPVLKLNYPRTKSSRPPETAVPVLKLYYPRTQIQPAAGRPFQYSSCTTQERKSSRGRRPWLFQYQSCNTKVVLPENANPAGRRRRPFQYSSCTTRERKSSRPPETAVAVLKLYYQSTKIQLVAGHGCSSTRVAVLKLY